MQLFGGGGDGTVRHKNNQAQQGKTCKSSKHFLEPATAWQHCNCMSLDMTAWVWHATEQEYSMIIPLKHELALFYTTTAVGKHMIQKCSCLSDTVLLGMAYRTVKLNKHVCFCWCRCICLWRIQRRSDLGRRLETESADFSVGETLGCYAWASLFPLCCCDTSKWL